MENAFLVRLSVSVWTARKLDREATREAKSRAGAADKAGVKLYKSVIAADALDSVVRIANAARVEHRKRTVPWAYDGPGAITAQGYPEYRDSMESHQRAFEAAVSAFYSVYESERAHAREYLGALFNDADYPTLDSLQGKFSFAVSCEPIPRADDFRVTGLDTESTTAIKKGIVETNAKALENANASAWARVIERVEKLKAGLAGYKSAAANGGKVEGKFHDTLVENVKELANLIPSINIANDPDLTEMRTKLGYLTVYTAQDLRDNANLRDNVIKHASTILAQISAKAQAQAAA